uniref:INCENP_ARK-bind domain-containing protein n=1 Tax=Parastrongyloides trichosuri TaxID=131310 RepID=A0A0N4ZC05_PARTI
MFSDRGRDKNLKRILTYIREYESTPNIRIRDMNSETKKKSIKNKLEGSGSGIKTFLKKTGQTDIKETFKRPLTGLFRKTPKDVEQKVEEVTISGKDSVVPFNKDSFTTTTDVIEIHDTINDDSDNNFKKDTPLNNRSTSLLSLSVIEAPKLTISEMNALYPLEILNNSSYNIFKVDDIDVSFLSRSMWVDEECCDEKVPWTWDYLYANVSYEMREESTNEEDEVEDLYQNSSFIT